MNRMLFGEPLMINGCKCRCLQGEGGWTSTIDTEDKCRRHIDITVSISREKTSMTSNEYCCTVIVTILSVGGFEFECASSAEVEAGGHPFKCANSPTSLDNVEKAQERVGLLTVILTWIDERTRTRPSEGYTDDAADRQSAAGLAPLPEPAPHVTDVLPNQVWRSLIDVMEKDWDRTICTENVELQVYLAAPADQPVASTKCFGISEISDWLREFSRKMTLDAVGTATCTCTEVVDANHGYDIQFRGNVRNMDGTFQMGFFMGTYEGTILIRQVQLRLILNHRDDFNVLNGLFSCRGAVSPPRL